MNYRKQLLLVLALIAPTTFLGCQDDSTSSPTTHPLPFTSAPAAGDALPICSFNIQFLGNFKDKDDPALASILTGYDR